MDTATTELELTEAVLTGSRWASPCYDCNGRHEACYSHPGRYGEGPIFAVVCPDDGLTSYYTLEVVTLEGPLELIALETKLAAAVAQ
jgi:hypothetical protein